MSKQQPLFGGIFGRTPKYFWIYPTVILLLFGFFKELKPSEAFLNPFLTVSPPDGKGLSQASVNDHVYPYWTYSYLVSAFFVFLFTDFMRYNPIILIESVSYLMTRLLLIKGSTVLAMQLMQVIYGVATATEVGYFTYLYSAVPAKYHVAVTGPIRAAVLAGRAVSSFAGQALYSTDVLGYYGLNYFSLISVCIATLLSFMLPWYFSCSCLQYGAANTQSSIQETTDSTNDPPIPPTANDECLMSFRTKLISQVRQFIRFYSTPSLLKWSMWWAFGMCGMLQVGNYVQSLWSVILEESTDTSSDKRHLLNGVIEGTTDLVAAFAALLASALRVNWVVWGELTMAIFSLVQSLLLFFSSHASKVWIAYICHILYRSSYSFMITIASSQLAISQTSESYGLIFGFNTFLALAMQTVLAVIVNTWLQLDTRTQFVIYGTYYYVLTAIFMFAGVYKIGYTGLVNSFRVCCKKPDAIPRRQTLYVAEDSSSSESSIADSEDIKELLPKIDDIH